MPSYFLITNYCNRNKFKQSECICRPQIHSLSSRFPQFSQFIYIPASLETILCILNSKLANTNVVIK